MLKKDKTVAVLLAFFLGGFGIHKLYLGENFTGLIYLLFSWTLIPSIFAIFDFLGLLFMSQDVFDGRYNPYSLPPSSGKNLSNSRSPKEITSAIAQLKKLYEMGAITAEEFEEKRQKLLDEL